ncbi:hypothetical protein ACFL2K_05230 [Candidatus Margulisiibacteriota bacterium]
MRKLMWRLKKNLVDWKRYALWLEQQCAEKFNSEIIAETKN